MQTYGLEAWLGDFRGELDDEQFDDLLRMANAIEEQYPDEDDQPLRDAAMAAAHQLILASHDENAAQDDADADFSAERRPAPSVRAAQEEVLADLARDLSAARVAQRAALAALRQAACQLVRDGDWSEVDFARLSGVDRARSLRPWLGK